MGISWWKSGISWSGWRGGEGRGGERLNLILCVMGCFPKSSALGPCGSMNLDQP